MKRWQLTMLILGIVFAGMLGGLLIHSVVSPDIAYADHNPGHVGPSVPSSNSSDPRAAGKENSVTGCTAWNVGKCISYAIAFIGESVMSLAGVLLAIAGMLLDTAINETVIHMGDLIATDQGGVSAVQEGWIIFRDLGNIILIFLFLAIGIGTILGVSNYSVQSLLPKLIVVALLINFSLFFTQLIIDGGNLLAAVAYNEIVDTVEETGGGTTPDSSCSLGISCAYLQALKLTTLYNLNGPSFTTLASNLEWGQIFFVTVLGTIMILIAAFAFFAAAILLIIRFGVLLFLMVLAPIAFVFLIIPYTSSYAKTWWKVLFDHVLFAPAYLLLTLFVIKIINSDPFTSALGLSSAGSPLIDNTNASVAGLISGSTVNVSSIHIFLNFFIVIVLLVASIIIAKTFSVTGSKAVVSWGDSLRKWGQGAVGGATLGGAGALGRTTLGRAASRIARSEGFQEFAGRTRTGEALLRGTRNLATRSYDFRSTGLTGSALGKAGGEGGFETQNQRRTARRVEFGRSLDRSAQARTDYAQRVASGPLTAGGSQQSTRSLFGALGRHNRSAASQLLRTRVNELTTEINQLTNEQRNLQQINAPTAAQEARLAQIPNQIEDRAAERNNLNNQINDLGLQNTQRQGY